MGEKTNGRGLHTIIGSGTILEGSLKVDHDVRVDGTIKGKVVINGDLIVGVSGVIEADIEVRSTKLGGKIIGNMIATERIELEEKSSLLGDIKTKDLVINEGAIFRGKCEMGSNGTTSK